MWTKFFAFACVAAVATLTRARAGVVAASPAGASLVSTAIEECGRVVSAEGYPPPKDVADIVRGLYAQPESNYGPSMAQADVSRPVRGERGPERRARLRPRVLRTGYLRPMRCAPSEGPRHGVSNRPLLCESAMMSMIPV